VTAVRGCELDPPASGTRVVHEMRTERVLEIRIEHAEQSFRGGRRASSLLVTPFGDPDDDAGLRRELAGVAHRTGWRPPLV